MPTKDTSNDNFETFSLFWLDATVNNSSENVAAQEKLRSIINQLRVYDDAERCERRIRSLSDYDRLVLIVSGGLGREIVPRIHHLRQVAAIYVYCQNKQRNEGWAKDYSKIKLVTTDLRELIKRIRSDQSAGHHRHNEPLAFALADRSTGEINGDFLHSQLLIDVLMRMETSQTEINELFCLFAPFYNSNEPELTKLREFQTTYRPDKAIWWYTRDSCIYRLLNKALRVHNARVLLVFRSFMRDLRKQIEMNQCSTPIRVYRGQVMSKEELNSLINSVGTLISMNSFLSTSAKREVAMNFSQTSNDLVKVLFEIDAHPQYGGKKPFAHVGKLSYFPDEDEVLFMLGSIFRIRNVQQQNDGIYHVQLTLCSDGDHDLKVLFDHMSKDLCGRDLSLLSFGDVLRRMGKFDEAETYYQWYLAELPANDPKIANCYHSLGQVAMDKGAYQTSLDWLSKAFHLFEKQNNRLMLGETYSTVGLVYFHKEQYTNALDAHNKALSIYRQELGDSHRNIGVCFDGMGAANGKLGRHAEALHFKQQAMLIWRQYLPPDHPDLGLAHTCMGNTHSCLGQLDRAMHHFNQSLEIYKKSLPHIHPRVAFTFKNMGMVYEKLGDYQNALASYEKAARIYRTVLPPDHADVVDIDTMIRKLSE